MMITEHAEVVLFYAEESLLFQVAAWVRTAGRWSLRLVASRDPVVVARGLEGAAVAIVDATRHPGEAMAVLERGVAGFAGPRVVIYSERMHDGLELFTRVRGAPLLLGPMTTAEWNAFFEPFERLLLGGGSRRQFRAGV